jgi:hypothetical protein
MVDSDSASVLKDISNSSTINNTSHITQILKDKIERLESRGKRIHFSGTLGTAVLKLVRGPTRRQSKQSKKVEIVNYYYEWQILKPNGESKAKKYFRVLVKTPNGTEEKDTVKGPTGQDRLRGSARSK